MVKGDMILTKPGEGRNNQKVIFVQKQIVMRANELKLGLKKPPVIIPKEKLLNQSSSSQKITTKDGKLVSIPIISKSIMQVSPGSQPKLVTLGKLHAQEPNQQSQQQQSVNQNQAVKVQTLPTPVKPKPVEVKQEKKKSESIPDLSSKSEIIVKAAEVVKVADVKVTPEGKF